MKDLEKELFNAAKISKKIDMERCSALAKRADVNKRLEKIAAKFGG
jgi:hypothetical protein